MKCPLVCAFVIILTVALSLFFMTTTVTVDSTFHLRREFSNKNKLNLSGKLTWESETFKKNMQMSTERSNQDQAYEILEDADIVPASARIRAKRLFNDQPLSIWTKDWKTTRLESLAELLKPFGVHFVVEIDPQYCSNLDCKVDERLEVIFVVLLNLFFRIVSSLKKTILSGFDVIILNASFIHHENWNPNYHSVYS